MVVIDRIISSAPGQLPQTAPKWGQNPFVKLLKEPDLLWGSGNIMNVLSTMRFIISQETKVIQKLDEINNTAAEGTNDHHCSTPHEVPTPTGGSAAVRRQREGHSSRPHGMKPFMPIILQRGRGLKTTPNTTSRSSIFRNTGKQTQLLLFFLLSNHLRASSQMGNLSGKKQ